MADDLKASFLGDDQDYEWEPHLQEVLEKDTLKWIFFGGKGGVGKTTNSSAFALQLAERRAQSGGRVLLLSTDPAHNVSDAFGQKFSSSPELVENCPHGNLFAMEIDPEVKMGEQNDELKEMLRQQQEAGQGGGQQQGNMLESLLGMDVKDISQSIPGIDEAMSFAEVLKMVKSMEFSCVIFDTAPTGHTLRFLAFPSMMQKTLGKFLGMRDKMGGMFSTMMSMLGGPQGPGTENALFDKLEEQMKTIEDVNEQFEDPELTTFVCVCIPEFLSVYETERLIQALTKYGIDCMAIIVNQVLFPPDDSSCELCHSRENMQKKYLDQIDMLYDEFHVVRMPLLNMEVRGIPSLLKFGNWQVQPFDPKKDSRKLDSDDRT